MVPIPDRHRLDLIKSVPPSRITDMGNGYSLRLDYNCPEDDPAMLAERLAEALNGALLRQADAEAFHTQARAERQKATELQAVVLQLDERKRNPPARVRRMDALAMYDRDKCAADVVMLRERAVSLQKQGDEYAQDARSYREQAERLQSAIRNKRRNGRGNGVT